jgi:hypothetical protein
MRIRDSRRVRRGADSDGLGLPYSAVNENADFKLVGPDHERARPR